MIGPAAMKGPRPGIASAPSPASRPSVPPTTPPVAAPTSAPSGALVCFSWATSCVLRTSGSSAEISLSRKPSVRSPSIAASSSTRVSNKQKTTIFLSCLTLDIMNLLLFRYFERVDDLAVTGVGNGDLLDLAALGLARHRSDEGDRAVLDDDLAVVSVGR